MALKPSGKGDWFRACLTSELAWSVTHGGRPISPPTLDRRDMAKRRRGFVLPMTLLVIALTAVVLVGFARQSLQRAEEAVRAEQNLQRKWGSVSCHRTLLEDAGVWLSAPPDELRGVGDAGHRRFVFPLGKLNFDVLLADEDAKINLNAMKRELPLQTVAQMVTELGQSPQPLSVSLRPYSAASAAEVGEEQTRELSRLGSWGQVFPMQHFDNPADAPRQIAAATLDLTCWGNGKLNLLRASESAIETLCHRLSNKSVARQLITVRSKWEATINAETIDEDLFLAGLGLGPGLESEEVARLATHLTNRSLCYSMWLNVTFSKEQQSRASQSSRKSWYEFHVVMEREQLSDTENGGDESEDEDPPVRPGEAERPEPRARPIALAHFAW